jgi:ABC-type antimicrobial peptide transport system permease subunit
MVGQRSREIGIRMALGAGRGGVLKLFLQKGIVLAGLSELWPAWSFLHPLRR